MNTYQISQELQKRKEQHERERNQRKRYLEQISPEYLDISMQQNALLAEIAMLRISGELEKAEQKKEQVEKIDKRKYQILKELSLPQDFLEVKYDCPICKDVGFTEDGKMCSCLKNFIREENFKEYDLSSIYKDQTFDQVSFDIFSADPEKGKFGISPREFARLIYDYASKFAKNFKPGDKSFILTGPVGTGKTYVISCLVNELLKKDVDLIYISAVNLISLLFEDIKTANNKNKEAFKNVDLLIIDDLGTEKDNDFNQSSFAEIINERILNNKTTIITSNYTPSLMQSAKRYPDRMVSRIIGNYDKHSFFGPDLRNPHSKTKGET